MMQRRRLLPTDDKSFVKDSYSTACLNIDTAGYKAYKQERERILRQNQLEHQVTNLQQDMGEIKQLLQQLLNGRTNGESNI